MVTQPKQRNLFAAAIPFVMTRHKESGGFGATRRLPATIQDTYHALNALNLCRPYLLTNGAESSFQQSEDNLFAYLTSCLRLLSATGIGTTFQLLWCCRAVGVEFDHNAVETALSLKMQDSESLEDWYYYARIFSEILKKHLVSAADQKIAAVLARTWRCVDEAWMHIYLARVTGRELSRPEPELIAWFQACQNGDGGFGFFPGTTSFIENCHACLRSLAFLGSKPLDLDRAALFLTGCQTAAGGFSRGGRAAPFLDATWHGLASLSLLSSIPSDHG